MKDESHCLFDHEIEAMLRLDHQMESFVRWTPILRLDMHLG